MVEKLSVDGVSIDEAGGRAGEDRIGGSVSAGGVICGRGERCRCDGEDTSVL